MVGVHPYGDEGDTTIADEKKTRRRKPALRAMAEDERSAASAASEISLGGAPVRPASYTSPVPFARALVREAVGRRFAKPKLPKLKRPEWAVAISWARSLVPQIEAHRVDGGLLLRGKDRLTEKGTLVLGIEGLKYTVSLEVGDGFHEAAERVTQRVMPGYEAALEYPDKDTVLIRLRECALDDMLAAFRTVRA